VGLCTNPVTLDYYMFNQVVYPTASQTFINPDNTASNLHKALVGCHWKGVGTITESQIALHLSDLRQDRNIYIPIVDK
jgi:hypothetical protein